MNVFCETIIIYVFSMVRDHWCNGAMFLMNRCGLVQIILTWSRVSLSNCAGVPPLPEVSAKLIIIAASNSAASSS